MGVRRWHFSPGGPVGCGPFVGLFFLFITSIALMCFGIPLLVQLGIGAVLIALSTIASATGTKTIEKTAEGPLTITCTWPEQILAKIAEAEKTSGLQYEDKLIGEGLEAKECHYVTLNYTGRLTNGTIFDSSLFRGYPLKFKLGAGWVIPGLNQGIAGMKVGGKRTLIIPSVLAYGSEGTGTGPVHLPAIKGRRCDVPPDATLVFEVELLIVSSYG